MTTFKNILVALLFFVSCNVLLAQNGYLKPTFPSEESSSSGFYLRKRGFVEVMTIQSLSLGLGLRLNFAKRHAFELSGNYDFINKVVVAKVGYNLAAKVKVFRKKIYPFVGVYGAHARDNNNGILFMPVYAGLSFKKLSMAYVRNFLVDQNGSPFYPLNQISLRFSIFAKSKKRYVY